MKTQSSLYNSILPSVVGCNKYQKLAIKTARQGIVGLKSEKKFVPLNTQKIKSVAVWGTIVRKNIEGKRNVVLKSAE